MLKKQDRAPYLDQAIAHGRPVLAVLRTFACESEMFRMKKCKGTDRMGIQTYISSIIQNIHKISRMTWFA